MAGLRVRFVLDGWSGGDSRLLVGYLGPLLEALALCNCCYLKAVPETPLLFRSGVRYQREAPGQEDWRDVPAILRHRGGDCEDLACWRVAELRVRFGVPARPIVTAQFIPWWSDRQGKPLDPNPARSAELARRLPEDQKSAPHWLYHIKVGVGTEREDPSRLLGMNRAELPNDYPEIV